MAAYFELVPCVPVGPQAGALGQLQTEEWVTSPQACASLLCCYFRIPVSVSSNSQPH